MKVVKEYEITILESTRVKAITWAHSAKEARELASKGEYDKLLETAIPVSDKVEKVQLVSC